MCENILDPDYSPIEFSLSKKSYCVNDRLQTNLTKIDANTEEQWKLEESCLS